MPIWGYDDAIVWKKKLEPDRVIYYQNNTRSLDPKKLIYNHLDSVYHKVDSAIFRGGIRVDIFDEADFSLTDQAVK